MKNENTGSTNTSRAAVTRRGMLKGAAIGASALTVVALQPALVSATPAAELTGWTSQVPGINAEVDTSHTSPEAARLFSAYFRAKSKADVEQTMSFFSRTKLTYVDATVGLANYTWQSQHDIFAMFMPHWPAGSASYPTRIIGDTNSAVVVYTDTAGLFGPAEIRAFGVVNFQAGKIVRFVDYWDGRHFGTANRDALKVPDNQFPADFKESTVGETAPKRLGEVTRGLAEALREKNFAKAAAFFAPDATFTDHPSHVTVTGVPAITAFLRAADAALPYVGPGTAVRHVVGSSAGGAYEWTAAGNVPRGAVLVELDRWGKISRLDGIWDGALVGDEKLSQLAHAALEH